MFLFASRAPDAIFTCDVLAESLVSRLTVARSISLPRWSALYRCCVALHQGAPSTAVRYTYVPPQAAVFLQKAAWHVCVLRYKQTHFAAPATIHIRIVPPLYSPHGSPYLKCGCHCLVHARDNLCAAPYPRAVKVAIAKDGICNLYRLHADWAGAADKLTLA